MKRLIDKIKSILNNKIVQNVFLVGGIALLIKFVGFFKETQVAASFGLSEILDTYFIAMIIPAFVSTVFLGSFKNVFIPNYIAELNSTKNISAFQGTGFFITCVVSGFFILIAYLATDVFLEELFPDHTESYYSLVRSQLYFLLPCILLWGLSALLSGLLNVNEEFRLSSMSNIFLPVITILFLYLLKDQLGANLLAIATLVGSLVGFLYLLLVSKIKNILTFSRPDLRNTNTLTMLKQLPAKVISSFLAGLNSVIDSYFAAQLVIGSVSAINYGTKIPMFAIGIAALALSNVLLPYFSKLVMTQMDKAYKTLFRMLKIIFSITTVIAIAGILTSDFFVALFFERNEFTAEDTAVVANIQKIILIYLPFRICGMLLISFLTSINKNNYQAYVTLISVILNIILDIILIKYFGVFGIAIATTVITIVRDTVLFLFTLKQRRLSLAAKS